MAKIIGPLFSNTASGSIGPRLTFSVRKSGQQARFQRAQKDVNSDSQNTQRGRYTSAVSWWKILTAAEKIEWMSLATT